MVLHCTSYNSSVQQSHVARTWEGEPRQHRWRTSHQVWEVCSEHGPRHDSSLCPHTSITFWPRQNAQHVRSPNVCLSLLQAGKKQRLNQVFLVITASQSVETREKSVCDVGSSRMESRKKRNYSELLFLFSHLILLLL